MKIGLFADPHYSSAEVTCGCRYNNRSLSKIKEAYGFFTEEKCDLVICLGDMIDRETEHSTEVLRLKEIARVIDSFDTKTIVMMGNHDSFCFEAKEFYGILGEGRRPRTINYENKTLLFLDACYYGNGRHYMPPDGDWTDTFFPDVAALDKTLKNSAADTEIYIFVHQNVDSEIPEDHRLNNAEELRSVLEKSGKVKTVYQVHYHVGKTTMLNGINYVTLPAMCESENAWSMTEI